DFDAGVDLLPVLDHLLEVVGGVDVGVQLQLAIGIFGGLKGAHVTVGTKRAVGEDAAHVFHADAGAKNSRVVVCGHLFDPLARDFAAVGGGAFGCNAFECHGLVLLGHGLGTVLGSGSAVLPARSMPFACSGGVLQLCGLMCAQECASIGAMEQAIDENTPRPLTLARHLFWQGYRVTDIAEYLEIPAQTIYTWRRRHGWEKARPVDR